jgi:hypothetical protein
LWKEIEDNKVEIIEALSTTINAYWLVVWAGMK